MRKLINMQTLRDYCFGTAVLPPEVLQWINKENLWNLWVPRSYGGLEASLSEGLQRLKTLARTDGSLGWTVTLCSGANYFIGNLNKEATDDIFYNSQKPILGGSGGMFGTAEEIKEGYKISGKWQYATGAPYLSHFTLNARILRHGAEIKDSDGTSKFLSFVIPKEKVQIVSDWNTMGLKATATHSFEVDAIVDEKYAFKYDHFRLPQPIFKIPFSVFADMTLWVNYLGIAEHYLEVAQTILSNEVLQGLSALISMTNQDVYNISKEIETSVQQSQEFTEDYSRKLHSQAADSVRHISREILAVYPLLGIKASSCDHQLNQIFRDYFTATQHHIFSK